MMDDKLRIGPRTLPKPKPSFNPITRDEKTQTQITYCFRADTVALAGVRTIAQVVTSMQFGRTLFLRQVIVSARKNSGADLWTTTDVYFEMTSANAKTYGRPAALTLAADGTSRTDDLILYCPASNMPMAINLGPTAFRIDPSDVYAINLTFSANFAGAEPLRGEIYLICDVG